MALIAAAVAGGLISAGATVGASLGAAKMQSNTAQSTNQTNLDFQRSMIDRGEKSFTDRGLPSFMYWGGNSNLGPSSLIHLGGQNFYEQSGINANLPYFNSSPWQQITHSGTPRTLGKNSAKPGNDEYTHQDFVNETGASFEQTSPKQYDPTSGQEDRMGLGHGRYVGFQPPQEYFDRRTQTDYVYTQDAESQATTSMRDTKSGPPWPSNFYRDASVQAQPSVRNWGVNYTQAPMSQRFYSINSGISRRF